MNATYSSVRRVYVRHGTKQAPNFGEKTLPRTPVNKKKAAFAAQALWRSSENEARWPAFGSTNAA
jgi:hypothetical protein